MADRRKLQGEIERCLKKVTEGVETFEDIWQKVHNATNTNQKEKYEADLKKEIKKLQRLRDQIKTWLASSDIKDKRSLIDNRKLIETQMERFKVVERETKTKAYSKEGLGAAQKLDPIQKERDEITNWLSASIDTLSVQVDTFESEMEALQPVQKKGKGKADRDKNERLDQLKGRIEKHRYHVKQLETLMRMLDNDTVTVDQIKKIKDDIEYYIESSQEDDFQDNDYIYDDLDLEDMMAFRANNVVDSTNPLTKSSSTTSASKSEANNSSNAASVDNDDSNAQSNLSSSSTNDSPAPSPGLMNSHSSSKSTSNPVSEFAFNTVNSSSTTISTSLPSNKPIWSTSTPISNRSALNTTPNQSTPTTNSITNSASSAPYASAVASLANASARVLQQQQANDVLNASNDTRSQANTSNSSAHHDPLNHLNHTSTSTVVTTLYSAAAAASAAVSSPATTVASNPWSNTLSGSNATEVTNHPMLATRQISNGNSQLQQQLTQQQQLILQQQQQQQQQQQHPQQNSHLLNGFKTLSSVETQNLSNLKSQQQIAPSAGHEDHLENTMLNSLNLNMANINLASNASGNVANSQINQLNDLSSSGQNSSSTTGILPEHQNLFVKNNLLIHQQNSQLPMSTNPPSASSVSPSNNSVSSVPINLSNNFNSSNNNNISTLDTSLNAPSSINTSGNVPLVNSANQSQTQERFFPSFGSINNPLNKSALSKQFLIQMHLLEAAFRHPIIPLDSHRLKPLTKLVPTATSPMQLPNYPNQILPQFDSLEFYQRLTPETLFFIFYYMEGTKAQYMAAKTLKNQSWRFHTKCMMWFQRLEEPKLITEEYEQGTYIYFDFERWQQRKKEGFIFEYKYLEDKDLN